LILGIFENICVIVRLQLRIVFTFQSQTNLMKTKDYLRKSIDKDELLNAVENVSKRDPRLTRQLNTLQEDLDNKPAALHKIALPIFEGFEILSIDNILYCLADSNYTHIVLKQSKKILISRTLKEIEKLLKGHGFLRVHHSHLINLNEIVRYVRGEGGYVIMSNNTPITVSRSHKKVLLQFFTKGLNY